MGRALGAWLLLALLPRARASCAVTPDANGHVDFPSGVTSVPSSAFFNCDSLVSITLPLGVTSIANHAFWSCGALASVTLPSGVTSISSSAFESCDSLASITLPSGLTSIGASAFSSCGALASVTLPPTLSSIGGSAFRFCSNLGLVHVPAGCTVGSFAFWNTAVDAPGYVLGLPPAPPHTPPGLPPYPLSCGPGTAVNAATNQCEIPCDDSSGRRMADEIPDESSDEPPTAVSTYLKRHPHLDEATVRHLVSLGRIQFEQHFGEPAVA
jgi:hypothetical protein